MTEIKTTHEWITQPMAGQGGQQICRLCGVRRSQQGVPCQPDIPHERRSDGDYDPFE